MENFKNLREKRVAFICLDDYEGLYIDGELVLDGHKVCDNPVDMLVLAELHNFKSTDVVLEFFDFGDGGIAELVDERGSFPQELNDLLDNASKYDE